jgi:ribonuclease HI
MECPMDVRTQILNQPPAFFNHGWVPAPPTLQAYREKLDVIPNTPIQNAEVNLPKGTLDLFTDGACWGPRDALTRLATWGVVVATPHITSDFSPIDSGLLPGRYQSVTRAELYAAIQALLFARRQQQPFRIWVDNQFVVRRLRSFLTNVSIEINVNKPNHDLLQQLLEVVQHTKHLCQGVIKVYSHQAQNTATDPVERWAFCGNQVADELATHEFYNYPDVLTMRQQLIAEVSRYETLRDQAHQVFIKVGKLAMTKSRTETQQAAEDPRRDLQLAPVRMRPWTFPDQLPPEAEHYFLDDWPCIAEWINSLHTGVGTVQFWSWAQLYANFQMMFVDRGPWFNLKQLSWESKHSMPNEPFVKRTR